MEKSDFNAKNKSRVGRITAVEATKTKWNRSYILLGFALALFSLLVLRLFLPATTVYQAETILEEVIPPLTELVLDLPPPAPTLDKEDYDQRLLILANYPKPVVAVNASTTASTTATTTPIENIDDQRLWPVKDLPYPNYGAILPFHRIIAYYGNFYSKGMGILGEYDKDTMLAKFREQIKAWEIADPDTPVMPAIDYIAVTAQAEAGVDGDYNLRMPDDQIDYALELAKEVKGIVILEVQVGQANLMSEIKMLEPYLSKPEVHLAIDPEFRMLNGQKPGEYVGTVSARDVNQAITYLSKLVQDHKLPPKVLVIHRFTANMVQSATNILPTAEVQVVMDMDGWGSGAKKKNTYSRVIQPEPVQFAGFKVFYKNDLKPPSTSLLSPAEIMSLQPRPIYIQYQ